MDILVCSWQVRKVCDPSIRQGHAQIPLEAFGRMLRRFTTLATPDALELVDEVAGQTFAGQRIIQQRH